MSNIFEKIGTALDKFMGNFDSLVNDFECEMDQDMDNEVKDGVPNKQIVFAEEVLDDFRTNVGKYKAETGGMLASKVDTNVIDICHFDTYSKNTSGSFYYDVQSMSEVFRGWKSKGYETNGIYHSHPAGCIRPSYHDVSTALLHLRFFHLNYFYLPILQPEHRGFYTMYFYVVREKGDYLNVNLEYVLNANENGYFYAPFASWDKDYPIYQLEEYRNEVDTTSKKEVVNKQTPVKTDQLFTKVKDLYPEHVLDKVIVCIGTGGARSALENFARSGFRNFILMDKDIVSQSNVATQGVFISELGKKKVEVIRNRILDINPNAKVICVDRFLDNDMTDEQFKGYLDKFPNKKPTDYLILGCTDNFEAQKRSSILALKYGIPYLAAMMYKGGAAAELIFVYPGVTESCPRCLLGSRFEKYENGFTNDVDSSACPIFATERMNATKGYIALMLLMYHEAPGNPFNDMLDQVKNRNFVQIRLAPNVNELLGINIFNRVFEGAERYTFMDETVWIPQKPDHPSNGYDECKLCGGTGHLEDLKMKWKDTRYIDMN